MEHFKLTESEVTKIQELRNSGIFISGGTGYIGKWLLNFIIHLNDKHGFNIKVYLLARRDNFDINHKVQNRIDIHFIKNDIRNLKELPQDIQYLIHAAASPDNREHMSNSVEIMDVISQGTKRILDAVLMNGNVKKILNLSSGQIYGAINSGHIVEQDSGGINCSSIKAIYPEAKRYAEVLCVAYKSEYKLPVVQVRPFSFIGPHMELTKPWAINNFIHDAIKFKKIKIFGNGNPIRSYMYPTDMVWWLVNILLHGKVGSAYNLGSADGISLKDLALKIKDKIGDIKIEVQNMNEDNSIFVPDISLVNKELDLDIRVNIDETLDKTIEWAKENI